MTPLSLNIIVSDDQPLTSVGLATDDVNGYSTRPIWMARGVDASGKNDLDTGHVV
jgi:hypothetical protein